MRHYRMEKTRKVFGCYTQRSHAEVGGKKKEQGEKAFSTAVIENSPNLGKVRGEK